MAISTDRRIREIGRRVSHALVESVGVGRGRPLIAGVSGGTDSSAMLLLLGDTRQRHGWRVHAAHIDHAIQSSRIRAEFAHASERVAALAGVPSHMMVGDALRRSRDSNNAFDGIEAAARRARYEALTQLAREHGAPIVAVAHTQDDQAETVLLHLLRGSGLDGLSGMPTVRSLSGGILLARPLLDVTRTEAEAVCCSYGWSPVHDPSNDDRRYVRNRVRHSVLPLMLEINPNMSQRLARLAQSVRSDRALLEEVGQQGVEDLQDEHGRLPLHPFRDLSAPMQNRVLRTFCREHGATLSAERIAAALKTIHGGYGVIELPGGLRLSVSSGAMSVE